MNGSLKTRSALDDLRGSNQSGVRAHNERLVLSILRGRGPTAKAEIARLTGLSAQTVSVITRGLEGEGLIERGAPVRGKVGQPSIPMRLSQSGAFFFGVKVGRRSADVGQGAGELDGLREKAIRSGARDCVIVDLRETGCAICCQGRGV